ncbi:MAG: VanZ family protein [Bacteroidales bacterium]|nr:VanZ family protein [Bacteroidales bacterium]
MNFSKLKYYHFSALSVYLLISYLCLTKQPYPSSFDFSFLFSFRFDLVVHGGIFFLLTKATLFQLMKMEKLNQLRLKWMWAVIIPILFGLSIEVIQYLWIEGRSGDVSDFSADVIGVFIAYYSFKFLSHRLSSK